MPERSGDLSQPISFGVTGWVQAWPTYNHHLIVSLVTPVGRTPGQLIIDTIPTIGTGSAGIGYLLVLGPVTVLPTLGLRYYGVTGASSDGFLYGPQGRLGVSVPILPWLAVTGKVAYAPWLQSMNKPGSGSFVELTGGLAANFGRLTYSIGYMGIIADPTSAGPWPVKGTFLGGPTGRVAFSL
jgi:hypothetical protein